MRTTSKVQLLVLLVGILLGGAAFADKAYKSVPSESADHGAAGQDAAAAAKASGLELKVVSYDGSVNGELTVEVRNPGKAEIAFSAQGLYFVPDGDANDAPQRLGAVGPMQIAGDKEGKRVDQVKVPAGSAVKVKLDVFCIDSHRPAPNSKTGFALGSKRLPAKLRGTIETRAKAAADEAGGYAAPAAKSRMQSEVWSARDSEWVEIDGEGKQEVGKKAGGRRATPPRVQRRAPEQAPQVQEQRKLD